ncbi:MBL fold metallo-hydrolase [Brevibacillus daliensis]|uniref:MBL fold metallo-hydrolase n=1 Tax=Brevibacillus daliensis TaxID=2892995 RepID=UPI001E38D4C9|nr:MBL fold metallo-hydrolase [Brevibacillus daliensis]
MKDKIDKEFISVEKVSLKDLLRWRRERRNKHKDLTYVIPRVQVERDFLCSNRDTDCLTFVGHCTFILQLAGLTIITDPVWAARMGLDKRLTAPGVSIEHVPPIDVVLISHNHYDHLHYASLRKLKGEPLFLVPKGLKKQLLRKGFTNVQEFEWWEQVEHLGVAFTFIPSLHWSRRTLFDLNKSLWGGWMMESAEKNIYFMGDTGYHNHFSKIGERFSIDYALIPIGSYEPEWFMGKQHMTPEQAVQSFTELNAHHFIPMHYDAYRLADETPKEALDRLHANWNTQSLDRNRLKVLSLGETLRL